MCRGRGVGSWPPWKRNGDGRNGPNRRWGGVWSQSDPYLAPRLTRRFNFGRWPRLRRARRPERQAFPLTDHSRLRARFEIVERIPCAQGTLRTRIVTKFDLI